MLRGINWGGKFVSNIKAPALSSWKETFIVVSPIWRPHALQNEVAMSNMVNGYLQHWYIAIIYASIVQREVGL